MTTGTAQDCCHRRRRHRPRGDSGRHRRDRGRDARHRRLARHSPSCRGAATTTTPRPDDGRRRLRAARGASTPSTWAPSATPRVADHVAVWDLLLPLRQRFQQYVNLRPMRLLPGLDVAAREPWRGRHRHGLRPGELRRRVRGPRRPDSRRHAARGRRADRPLHAARHRADPPLRLRAGRHAAAEAAGQRDQVERAAPFDGVLGRGRRMVGATTRRSTYRKYHVDAHRGADGLASADARRDRRVEPVRRHPHGHRFGHLRQPRHRARREHQPRARLSLDVRADSRLGARHRRQGHRQPDRRDLGRRDDARPPRSPRPPRPRSSAAIERVVASGKSRTPDLGGQAKTKELADAIRSEI